MMAQAGVEPGCSVENKSGYLFKTKSGKKLSFAQLFQNKPTLVCF